jgi:hypothetical protein
MGSVAIEHGAAAGSARLFPSDPRAALLLVNEARYVAVQGAFGVRRDQVNLMTLITAVTIAEGVRQQARRLHGPTRGDLILADGALNALGAQVAGPFAREIPFFAALIGAAAAATVATSVLRYSAHYVRATASEVTDFLLTLRPRFGRSDSLGSGRDRA